ncbi:hypothetical protein ACVIHH_000088 [Bradyrhizobium sp. USDA 4518]
MNDTALDSALQLIALLTRHLRCNDGRVIGTVIADSMFSIDDAPLKNGESVWPPRKAVVVMSVVLATSAVAFQTLTGSSATTGRLQRLNAARGASFFNEKLSSAIGMSIA